MKRRTISKIMVTGLNFTTEGDQVVLQERILALFCAKESFSICAFNGIVEFVKEMFIQGEVSFIEPEPANAPTGVSAAILDHSRIGALDGLFETTGRRLKVLYYVDFDDMADSTFNWLVNHVQLVTGTVIVYRTTPYWKTRFTLVDDVVVPLTDSTTSAPGSSVRKALTVASAGALCGAILTGVIMQMTSPEIIQPGYYSPYAASHIVMPSISGRPDPLPQISPDQITPPSPHAEAFRAYEPPWNVQNASDVLSEMKPLGLNDFPSPVAVATPSKTAPAQRPDEKRVKP